MGYMLPLKFIRVSENLSICATRIVAIMSTKSYACRNMLKEERAAGTLLNGAGHERVRSAIILDNGTVVSSSFDPGRILSNINKAGLKHAGHPAVKVSSAIKVYDAIDDKIFDGMVEEFPDMSATTKRREGFPAEEYEEDEDAPLLLDGEEVEDE